MTGYGKVQAHEIISLTQSTGGTSHRPVREKTNTFWRWPSSWIHLYRRFRGAVCNVTAIGRILCWSVSKKNHSPSVRFSQSPRVLLFISHSMSAYFPTFSSSYGLYLLTFIIFISLKKSVYQVYYQELIYRCWHRCGNRIYILRFITIATVVVVVRIPLIKDSFLSWYFCSRTSGETHHPRFIFQTVSPSCTMCDAPSKPLFCTESIECFPGILSWFFSPLLTIPVAPIITGMTKHFAFHITLISRLRFLCF